MDPDTFYSTTASLCFTLLGFWWAVVQFRYDEWMKNADRRMMAYTVSLHFLLPGVMSLLALVVSESPLLWRTVFTIAGATGVTAMVFAARGTRDTSLRLAIMAQWVGVPIYALIMIFALVPDLPRTLGFALTPLELEGIFLGLLIFLGVNVAWLLFSAPRTAGNG